MRPTISTLFRAAFAKALEDRGVLDAFGLYPAKHVIQLERQICKLERRLYFLGRKAKRRGAELRRRDVAGERKRTAARALTAAAAEMGGALVRGALLGMHRDAGRVFVFPDSKVDVDGQPIDPERK